MFLVGRDELRVPLNVVGAAAVVPHDPPARRRPPGRRPDQVAPVGPEQQVRAGQQVEAAPDALTGPGVVEDDQLGHEDGIPPQAEPPGVADVVGELLQPGRSRPSLERVPA